MLPAQAAGGKAAGGKAQTDTRCLATHPQLPTNPPRTSLKAAATNAPFSTSTFPFVMNRTYPWSDDAPNPSNNAAPYSSRSLDQDGYGNPDSRPAVPDANSGTSDRGASGLYPSGNAEQDSYRGDSSSSHSRRVGYQAPAINNTVTAYTHSDEVCFHSYSGIGCY
jgi:hypothetical protein